MACGCLRSPCSPSLASSSPSRWEASCWRVGGGLLLATSDFLVDPVAYGIQTGIMVFGAVAAGLVWVRRRPGNRVGPLLLALALVTAVVALQGVDSAYLHSLGVLVEPVFFLLTYVVVFAFPEGKRDRSRGAADPRRDDALLPGRVRPVDLLLARSSPAARRSPDATRARRTA